jgi:hypothetical protein
MPIFGDHVAQTAPGEAPMGAPPGAAVRPDPSQMALANQVYQLQQLVVSLQRDIADMRNRRINVRIDLVKDRDGRTVGMVATEGTE